MRVDEFLARSADAHPSKTAILAEGRRVTYRELDALADRAAGALKKRGVQRGDRVIMYLENGLGFAPAMFGTLRAGGVFSPVNPTMKPEKLAYIIRDCRPAAIVTQARLLAAATAAVGLAGPAPCRVIPVEDALADAPVRADDARVIDVDLAMVIYTSGSTGLPKGVMMTHRNIVAAASSIATYLEMGPGDVVLNVLPFSFDYGLYQLILSVEVGATLVVEKGFAFPEAVLRLMEQERVTGFPLVPTMAAMLLQMRDLRPGRFPHLRYITNTGAALPPAHVRRLQELFPATRIFSMYGLTECKRCTFLPPEQLARRPGSVGKAIPNTEAYVVDEQGKRLGAGLVGELVIRGAHVMQGYWGDAEATARVLRPGLHPGDRVLHTGDLFRMDGEGFLYFVGRTDDIIKTRGEKVSPKEVEEVLYALPGVKEAAVVGVPDAILGMAIKALVVPGEGAGIAVNDVLRHCAERLEDFKVPRFVQLRRELPKTPSGKIRRSQLQAEELSAAQSGADAR